MDDSKHRTVLIAAFEGWNDAGQAASGAIRHLLKALEVESRQVDRISCSPFFDYQFTRPMMCTVDGRRQIMWPQVTFSSIDLSPSLTLLTELGPEPNFQWMEFAQKSLRIADAYEVDEIITLGSMFNRWTPTPSWIPTTLITARWESPPSSISRPPNRDTKP